jgi:hypothetical protein
MNSHGVFLCLITIVFCVSSVGFITNQIKYSKNIKNFDNITIEFTIDKCKDLRDDTKCINCDKQLIEIPCSEDVYGRLKFDYFIRFIHFKFYMWWTSLLNLIFCIFLYAIVCLSIVKRKNEYYDEKEIDELIFCLCCICLFSFLIIYYVGWTIWSFMILNTYSLDNFILYSSIILLLFLIFLCLYKTRLN